MANQELEQKHADDLSVTRYGLKKVREILITSGTAFGGALLGGFIGGKTGKGLSQSIGDIISSMPEAEMAAGFGFLKNSKLTLRTLGGAAVGFLAGSVVGGVIIGYEHWRKQEAAKLAVDEINKDIANTIAIQPTDQELVQENKRLREILAQGPKSHREHADAHSHSAGRAV